MASTRNITIHNLLITCKLNDLRMNKLMRTRVVRSIITIRHLRLLNMRLQVLATRISRMLKGHRVALLANLFVRLNRNRLSLEVAVNTISLTFFKTRINVRTINRLFNSFGNLLITNRLVMNSNNLSMIARRMRLITLLGRTRTQTINPCTKLSLMENIRMAVQLLDTNSRVSHTITRHLRLKVQIMNRHMNNFLGPLMSIKVLRSRTVRLIIRFTNNGLRINGHVTLIIDRLITN